MTVSVAVEVSPVPMLRATVATVVPLVMSWKLTVPVGAGPPVWETMEAERTGTEPEGLMVWPGLMVLLTRTRPVPVT